jgi:hypothetical protein
LEPNAPGRSLDPIVAARLAEMDSAVAGELRELRLALGATLDELSAYFGHDRN